MKTVGTLAERKTQVTRDAILDALVKLVAAEGVHEFSVQRVADTAGVTHRTVYRHFPTREALLGGLAASLQTYFRKAYGVVGAEYPDLVPGQVGELFEKTYRLFEAQAERVSAFVTIGFGARVRSKDRETRKAWIQAFVRAHGTHLDEQSQSAAAAMIHALGSSTTWLHLRRNVGASPDAMAQGVRWAVDTLVADIERGGGPGA